VLNNITSYTSTRNAKSGIPLQTLFSRAISWLYECLKCALNVHLSTLIRIPPFIPSASSQTNIDKTFAMLLCRFPVRFPSQLLPLLILNYKSVNIELKANRKDRREGRNPEKRGALQLGSNWHALELEFSLQLGFSFCLTNWLACWLAGYPLSVPDAVEIWISLCVKIWATIWGDSELLNGTESGPPSSSSLFACLEN